MSKLKQLIKKIQFAGSLAEAKEFATQLGRDQRIKVTPDSEAKIIALSREKKNPAAIGRILWAEYGISLSPPTIRKVIRRRQKGRSKS